MNQTFLEYLREHATVHGFFEFMGRALTDINAWLIVIGMCMIYAMVHIIRHRE